MATNIMFKRGYQAQLPATAQDGVFYLTQDTNRLYVGQGEKMALLNQTVQIVADVDSLPSSPPALVNDFYYCTKENVLAVYTGTEWKQINPDTDTNDKIEVTGVDVSDATYSNDTLTYTFDIKQQKTDIKNNPTQLANVQFALPLTKADLEKLLPPPAVGLDTSKNGENTAKINTIGQGADNTNFINIVGGENVSVDVNGDNITISAKDDNTTYTLSAKDNEVVLKGSNDENDTKVKFSSENDAIEISTIGTNEIQVAHKEYAGTKETGAGTVSSDRKFSAITEVTLDKGHVSGYKVSEFTLPEDKNTTNASATVETGDNGSITVKVVDSDSKTVTATAEDLIYYMVNGAKVHNKGNIEFYTKSEIDTKLNTIDSMTYKGTVDDTHALPVSDVHVGDTYKVAAIGTYAGVVAEVGDIFIAAGTEKDGVIDGEINWTYIPSGDDTDTKYEFELVEAENSFDFVLTDSVSEDEQKVSIVAGDAINLKAENNVLTIDVVKPAEIKSTTSESNVSNSFEAITSLGVNEYGQVETYHVETYVLPEDKDTTSTLSLEKNHTIKLTESDEQHSEVILANDDYITLTDNTETDTITIGHATFNEELAATKEDGATLEHNGKITVVTGISRNNGGHITGYTTKEYTLPADTNEAFTLSGATVSVSNNKATFTTSLTGSKGTNSDAALSIVSDNLTIAADGNNGAKIDLVWGSF